MRRRAFGAAAEGQTSLAFNDAGRRGHYQNPPAFSSAGGVMGILFARKLPNMLRAGNAQADCFFHLVGKFHILMRTTAMVMTDDKAGIRDGKNPVRGRF